VVGAWSANDPFFAGPGRERKAAAVIYTRGVYSPGAPLVFGADFHSTFLNDWLRFAASPTSPTSPSYATSRLS
jgi:hypothetical protein